MEMKFLHMTKYFLVLRHYKPGDECVDNFDIADYRVLYP